MSDSNVAASLQSTQQHLQFQRHAITIRQKLHRRPSRAQLVQDHILVHDKEFDVDPKVTDAIISLQKARTISALEDTIANMQMRGPIHPLDFMDLQLADDLLLAEDDTLASDMAEPSGILEDEDSFFSEGDYDDDETGDEYYYTDSDHEDIDSRRSSASDLGWAPQPLSALPSSSSTGSLRRLSDLSLVTDEDNVE